MMCAVQIRDPDLISIAAILPLQPSVGRLIQSFVAVTQKQDGPRSEIEVEVLLSLLAKLSAPSTQHLMRFFA